MFKNNSKENIFLSSAKELKKVQALSVCAMFAALSLILNQVASITIGPYIKIGFSGIPNQLADYLFGPVTGGFTFNAILASLIYGCFYYKKKLTLKRVLLAKFVVFLVVNVILSTLWLDMLYGKGFLALLPMRALKNVIMWPIDSFIFFSITKVIEQTGVFRPLKRTA